MNPERRQQRRIAWRLWWAAALPALLVVLVLGTSLIDRYLHDVSQAWRQRAVATAQQLVAAAEFALFADNRAALQRLASGVRERDPQVLGVALLGADQRLRALAGEVPLPERALEQGDQVSVESNAIRVVAVVHPRIAAGDDWFDAEGAILARPSEVAPLGYVVVRLDTGALQRQRRAFWGWLVLWGLAALVLAGALAYRIAASVTHPLAHISEVVARIGRGEKMVRTVPSQRRVLAELGQGIDAMAETVEQSQQRLEQRVREATDALRAQKEQAERMARIDSLTGLATRRAFVEAAHAEVLRAHRFGEPLGLLMFDLDHFKAINDTYGHAVGDAVLAQFGHDLVTTLRGVDMIARLGGEEFVALLPRCGLDEAHAAAERVRAAVEQRQLKHHGHTVRYTVSVGVATLSAQDTDWEALLARADQALYAAKRQGRNQVAVASASGPAG